MIENHLIMKYRSMAHIITNIQRMPGDYRVTDEALLAETT